jgi:hypothetical protein
MRTFYIGPENPFGSPELWDRLLKRIALLYTPGVYLPIARWVVYDHYAAFRLIGEVEALQTTKRADMQRFSQRSVREVSKRGKRAITEDSRNHEDFIDRALARQAKPLLKKHDISLADLERWRSMFLDHGTFGLSGRGSGIRHRRYFDVLTDETLIGAEEPYRLAHLVNWFIQLCGGEPTTLKELILGFQCHRCEICFRPFEPRTRRQVTCGAPPCEAEHKRRYRVQQRRLGRRA